jgi:hypothetical protein
VLLPLGIRGLAAGYMGDSQIAPAFVTQPDRLPYLRPIPLLSENHTACPTGRGLLEERIRAYSELVEYSLPVLLDRTG